MLVKENNKTIF